jgi:hypothetical protein
MAAGQLTKVEQPIDLSYTPVTGEKDDKEKQIIEDELLNKTKTTIKQLQAQLETIPQYQTQRVSIFGSYQNFKIPNPEYKKIQDQIETLQKNQANIDKYKTYAKQVLGVDYIDQSSLNKFNSIISLMQNQFDTNGTKPEEFVKNFELKDIGNGVIGLVNKNKSKIGSDYIYNNGQWIERNRTTGWTGPNDISNEQQANNRLKDIQRQINSLNSENDAIKNDPLRGYGKIGGGLDAVKANEQKINELRKEYDSISGSVENLKLNPAIEDYITRYLEEKNAADVKETLDPLKKKLGIPTGTPANGTPANGTPTIGVPRFTENNEYGKGNPYTNTSKYADFNNQFADPVLNAYLKSLEDPFNLQSQDIQERMASRGLSGSGITQENLGRLAAEYEKAKNVKTGNLTGDYYKNQVADINQKYQNDVTAYMNDLESAFKDSGQTANDFYAAKQAQIGVDLEAIANKYNQMYSDVKTQYDQDTTTMYANMDANKNVFNAIGSTIGGYFGSQGGGSQGGGSNYNWKANNDAINNLGSNLDPWSSYNNNPYNTGRTIQN